MLSSLLLVLVISSCGLFYGASAGLTFRHLMETEYQSTVRDAVTDTNAAPADADFPQSGEHEAEKLFHSLKSATESDMKRSADTDPFLIFGNKRFIVAIKPDGTFQGYFDLGLEANVIAVDVDCRNDIVFWSDVARKQINAAYFNGSNATNFVSTDINVPDGLAWDWVNLKLYWTDAQDKEIEVLDPITGYRRVLIETGTSSIPRAIVLDPERSTMYWTDWGTPARIETASMDGSGRKTIHSTGLGWPNALTLDYDTQTLYWADALYDRVESSSTSGLARRVLISTSIYHPFGITFYDDRLYWTDWLLDAVLTSPSTTSSVSVVFSGLNNDPMGIHMVAPERQPAASFLNLCFINNGGCSHLCLLSSVVNQRFTCSCPAGMVLSLNGKTCIGAGLG